MGREEGGGFRMGNTCIPVADSFWYLAKLIQLCKVLKNKMKLKKKKKENDHLYIPPGSNCLCVNAYICHWNQNRNWLTLIKEMVWGLKFRTQK